MRIIRKILFNLSYFGNPRWDTHITPPEVSEYINNHTPGRALELGCGTGTNAITLSKNGWNVTAIDFSAKAISIAREKACRENAQIRWYIQDVSRPLVFEEKFDLILDIGCYHSLANGDKNLYRINIKNYLAPQGHYFLYAFIKEKETNNPGITKSDMVRFQAWLTLQNSTVGMDHNRVSGWYLFTPKK